MENTKIVCFCGSTRFASHFMVERWKLEKQGIITLGINILPDGYFAGENHHGAEQEGVKDVLDELHKRKIDISDEVERNAYCRECKDYNFENNCHKLTFANFKKIFICIINTDERFHSIEELSTKTKRKEFSIIYNTYIENRNYFTHGKLFFLNPNMEPVLKVKMIDSEQLLKIEKTFYKKNIDVFVYIEEVLEEVLEILNLNN